jgi:hypothetical protein
MRAIALVAAAVFQAATGVGAQEAETSVQFEPLSYTRVIADADLVSHFEDGSMALATTEVGGTVAAGASTLFAAEGVRFFCFAPGTSVDWHPAPGRQLYLILSGELEMEVGDGEVRRFERGSVLLGEATEGRGVKAQWGGRERPCVAVAPLE